MAPCYRRDSYNRNKRDGSMGHFIITFRIKDTGSYQKRYDSFVEKVKEISTDRWEETSSFYAITATGTAQEICDTLYLRTDFVEAWDQMVVIDLDRKEKAFRGPDMYEHTLGACLGF
ncbi:hypothetical protein B6D51_01330 [Pseudomonas chlororaphis subsp. chlororaphis]|nr:hypothetical protein B6D51_01330 [Pseudomonas chlororaphis subsp. chlororaphis]TWR99089.1 hypothetical protein FJD36_03745 [Pseudomonas chlororaphis subsp. chlororaphis]